jgi:hypothetical protein
MEPAAGAGLPVSLRHWRSLMHLAHHQRRLQPNARQRQPQSHLVVPHDVGKLTASSAQRPVMTYF